MSESNGWLVPGGHDPGFLGEPAPLGSLGLQSLVPRPKSQNPKNCFGAFDCQKIAFGVLSFQKLPSAFLIVENVLAFLVITKLPGHSKLSKNAMQWMQSKAMFSIVKTLPLAF